MDVVLAMTLVAVGWLAVTTALTRNSTVSLRERVSTTRGRALLGMGIGLSVGIGLLVARTDVLPDSMEPTLIPVALALGTVAVAVVGWLAWAAGR